jgi:hypothetical protein
MGVPGTAQAGAIQDATLRLASEVDVPGVPALALQVKVSAEFCGSLAATLKETVSPGRTFLEDWAAWVRRGGK